MYPSVYEGFGLPILEAFAQNCPVILPRASCFPEVAGEGALYYEVNDKEGLVNSLNAVLNENIRTELLQKAQKRLTQFSWEKSVKAHIQVYEQVIKSKSN